MCCFRDKSKGLKKELQEVRRTYEGVMVENKALVAEVAKADAALVDNRMLARETTTLQRKLTSAQDELLDMTKKLEDVVSDNQIMSI